MAASADNLTPEVTHLRSAHLDEINLHPAISALILGDDAANAGEIKYLPHRRGLRIADNFQKSGAAIDKPGFGRPMTFGLFIGYTE